MRYPFSFAQDTWVHNRRMSRPHLNVVALGLLELCDARVTHSVTLEPFDVWALLLPVDRPAREHFQVFAARSTDVIRQKMPVSCGKLCYK